ncbi:MAG: hypothetical protein JWP45_2298 [Mucilaginibacter sp.]|nr:hypothetical protein [Mucilaginibacter sp.]
MKYFYILLTAFILTGCVKRASIEFAGVTPGIKNGVFIVKTLGDSALYGENIKDGKFTMAAKQLKYPDYYKMNITDNDNNDTHEPFEIYLEDGKYVIETQAGQLYKYPKITSPSKIQEQLSAFYTLTDKLSLDVQTEIKQLNKDVKDKGNSLSGAAYTALLNKLSLAENKLRANNVNAFSQFVKQYPNSVISTHLMSKLNYEDDPVSFYAIYKTLTPEARNTDEGKEIGQKLSHLVKLVPGVKAPAIYGNTPDGKPFDPKAVTGKVILVDFWRAGNSISRENHQRMKDIIGQLKNKNDLQVVSISLDTKADWWKNAINEDNINWPQVSDLKGDDSPNAANWSITTIPTYYLLDGSWNIIERNIDIGSIYLETSDYLKKHH